MDFEQLTKEQQDAVFKLTRFIQSQKGSDGGGVFRLFGLAGTGKSTVLGVVEKSHPDVREGSVYLAPTHKACDVLRRKGIKSPRTVTSFASYFGPRDPAATEEAKAKLEKAAQSNAPMEEINELRRRFEELDGDKISREKTAEEIAADMKRTGKWAIIVDECSMLPGWQCELLREVGCPVIAVGDPRQLDPIQDQSRARRFCDEEPTVLLREPVRQASGSQINVVAQNAEQGRSLSIGVTDCDDVEFSGSLSDDDALDIDMILCGTNRSRVGKIRQCRRVRGLPQTPVVGEPVIYRGVSETQQGWTPSKNDLGTIAAVDETNGRIVVTYRFRKGNGDQGDIVMPWSPGFLDWEKPEMVPNEFYRITPERHFIAYAYAITVYSAQGGEWDSVAVVGDRWTNRMEPHDWKKWAYTAVTRAKKRLIVCNVSAPKAQMRIA